MYQAYLLGGEIPGQEKIWLQQGKEIIVGRTCRLDNTSWGSAVLGIEWLRFVSRNFWGGGGRNRLIQFGVGWFDIVHERHRGDERWSEAWFF
jgi:hypothetical protein